jgi:trigger factor
VSTEVEEEKQELKLDVNIDETSACGRHITVTIGREEIERYFSEQFDDLVPKAEIPGFRAGKAPRKLVEKKFRKQLTDQVKGQLIMDSLAQVNGSEEFSAISEPDLDYEQVSIPEEGDFKYEFNIEVRPEFDLPEYKSLKLDRPEYEFTDKDIDNHISKLSQQFSTLAPVDEAIQAGDFAICNVTSKFEDEVVSSHEEVSVQVLEKLDFADGAIEGFDKLMVGAKAEETKSTTVTLGEFADNEALRGKKVEVEFEILDVKRVEAMPNDEVATSVGLGSAEELNDAIRKMLEERLEYSQRQTVRDQISSALTESATWELPEELLDRQAKREVQRAVMEMQSSGFSQTEIVARENELRKNVHERTATALKEHFILERIAEEENIEDAPQDYEIEIMKLAIQQRDTPRRIRSRLERTGQMDALRNMIIERKVIDMITENAKIKATDYEQEDENKTSSVNLYFGGQKQDIPQAKYDGGDAPAIPGTDKDKK